MCRIIVTGYLAEWDASSETLSPPSKEIVVKECKKKMRRKTYLKGNICQYNTGLITSNKKHRVENDQP